ncbi:hypothetical protein [Paenibacillus sp. OV219]|uniref:hypothetical protein n=1 Tax=Paenibacillus sp. OV219 TaxID=1884377 RepID=UPI0008B72E7C|nr:hypothetical protein [Paenibacillus sp. OV219]SEM52347.1 hypothetical protein SAMN05518847_10163 [Paenibacillus sp. OV219]
MKKMMMAVVVLGLLFSVAGQASASTSDYGYGDCAFLTKMSVTSGKAYISYDLFTIRDGEFGTEFVNSNKKIRTAPVSPLVQIFVENEADNSNPTKLISLADFKKIMKPNKPFEIEMKNGKLVKITEIIGG